jgi:hypothetical protein
VWAICLLTRHVSCDTIQVEVDVPKTKQFDRQLEGVLEAERFDYTEASKIANVPRHQIVNWVRRGVLRLDHLPRLHRPSLTIHDLFRLFLGARLVQLGLPPETAFGTLLSYGPKNVFEVASQKAAGSVHWADDNGCLNTAVFYGPGDATPSQILSRGPAVLVPEKHLAHELIRKVVDFLASAEKAQIAPEATG